MGRRSFLSKIIRRRRNKQSRPPSFPASATRTPPPPPFKVTPARVSIDVDDSVPAGKTKKKAVGSRLWMRFDRLGNSEIAECEKSTIIQRTSVPARDLRILGPVFSNSSNILGREKAMVVNLEFIRAIVTADEVLILDPLQQEVILFVDQLREQFLFKKPQKILGEKLVENQDNETRSSTDEMQFSVREAVEKVQYELPFELRVLEIALEVVCAYLGSKVAVLEDDAYPVLDELAKNVSTKSLESVRNLKSNLTHLLASVQKVRDEIEHLLDDNEDMAQLYLTRKWIQIPQSEASLENVAPCSVNAAGVSFSQFNSSRSTTFVTDSTLDVNDVEELEMLLEAFFTQLEGVRNKILSVREYIDDTEDYVNIQLDNQRNEMIQLQLTLRIVSFAIGLNTMITSSFGMNIPCPLYDVEGIFGLVVGGSAAGCFLVLLLVLRFVRWKKLLG